MANEFVARNGVIAQNNSIITGSLTVTAGITGSLLGTASYAITASSADSFNVRTSLTASNLLVSNTITAQTLVVQTITSSIEYSSGSNIFGSLLTNTQQFTGSVNITGSLSVAGNIVNNLTASYASNANLLDGLDSTVFATTGSNIFIGDQKITGSLFISASTSNTAINTNGDIILSGSLYASASYSSTAIRIIGNSIITGSQTITGSLTVTGSVNASRFTGSLFGSASYATTASYTVSASYAPVLLTTKINQVLSSSFSGNPKKATVTFSSSFANINYGVLVTGQDLRSWTIESKVVGSFIINSNSNVNLSGSTYWMATEYGEA